jgi:large subunit ribosomal protein L6
MSRIGFKPIALPTGVTFLINGGVAAVKGPKGELSVKIPSDVSVAVADGKIHVKPLGDLQQDHENHGTTAANLHNAVVGVSEGWKKELEISGIGFRCLMKGKDIALYLGYTHEILVSPLGQYTKISTPDETHVVVEGVDRQAVGQTAALIHDARRPDPYAAKGVKYKGEVIIRKVGKRAAATTAPKK